MGVYRIVSLIGFWFVGLALSATGIRYLLADRIMSYHQTAIGMEWGEMSEGMRVMSLNFMRGAGSGFLVTGLVVLVLAWFSRSMPSFSWARMLLLGAVVAQICLVLRSSLTVQAATSAQPPLFLTFTVLAIAVISFVCGLAGSR